MTDNHRPASARPARPRLHQLAAGALLLALAAACSPAAAPTGTPGPGSSGSPTSTPTPTSTPVADGISHPTGATDIVLRMETGGGFAPIEFMATSAPSFTLFGDGTVVFRDSTAVPPEAVGNVMRSVPFQTVRQGEAGIQALLAETIGPGGLGIAVGPYGIAIGADLPTTTFTITADERTKQVSVTGGFLPDMHPKDAAIIASLAHLVERLDGFARDVPGEQPYVPEAYRGILMKVDQPFGPVVDWPWTSIQPVDFVSGENAFFMTRTLTLADVQALGIPDVFGGMQGLALKSKDQLYTFALRPLLPDETM